MSTAIDISGTSIEERFKMCREILATDALNRAKNSRRKPYVARVYTPTIFINGRWGLKTAFMWSSSSSMYLVGYDAEDPNQVARIYRRQITNSTPGGASNPTYEVLVMSQDSALDRLEAALRSIG